MLTKNPNPFNAPNGNPNAPNDASSWAYFVREYQPDLSSPKYSSIIRGQWDRCVAGNEYSKDVFLKNMFKTEKGILMVGYQDSSVSNSDIIIVNGTPTWGSATPNGT